MGRSAQRGPKRRLDERLVDEGLAESRTRAQALILAGVVLVDDQPIDKVGTRVADAAFVRVRGGVSRFVSRGGYSQILDELDRLLATYGERNMPQPEEVRSLREQVAVQLTELDAERSKQKKAALEDLAQILVEASEDELHALVKQYIKKYHSH